MANNPIKFKDLADLRPGIEEAAISLGVLEGEFNTLAKSLKQLWKRVDADASKSVANLKTLRKTVKSLNASIEGDQKSLKGAAKVIIEEEKAIKSLRESQKGLESTQKALTKSSSSYREELKRLRVQAEDAFQKKDIETVKQTAKAIKDLKAETDQLSKATRGANSIFTAATSSYDGLQLQLSALKKEFKALDGAIDPLTGDLNKNNKEAVKLNDRINELHSTLKKADKAIGQSFRNVGNYAESIIEAKNALDKQKRSLEQQVTALQAQRRATNKSAAEQREIRQELSKTNAQLEKVNAELKNFGEGTETAIDGLFDKLSGLFSAGGLIAAGALVLTALSEAFTVLKDEIVQTNKQLRIIESVTGLAGGKLDSLTAKIKATAKTFGKDFNEILQAGNALMKTFDLSAEEAFDTINEGLASGLDLNGDFLDQLKEYSVQFKAAGLNANDLYNILKLSTQEGIFSDKAADTIKEAGLSLREFTKATRDALKPLGKEFNDQIQEAIASGDTFKAIQLVSKGLSEVNLTASETQTIIADVFKGAGEDAGLDFIKTLAGIKTGQDAANRSFTEAEQELLDLNKANEEYAASLVKLSANFKTVGTTLSILWTEISTVGVDALNAIVGSFVTAEGKAKNFVETLNTFSDAQLNEELKKVNKELEKTSKALEATKKLARESGQLGLVSTNQIGLEQEYQGLLIKREGIQDQLNKNLEEYREAFRKHSEEQEKGKESTKKVTIETKELTDSQKDLVALYGRAIDKTLEQTTANYKLAQSYFAIKEAQAKERILNDPSLEGKGFDDGKEDKSAFLLSIDEWKEEEDRIAKLEKLAKETLDRVNKAFAEAEEERTKKKEEEQDKRNAIVQSGLEVASEAVSAISQISYDRYVRETEQLRAQKAYELSLVADNENAKAQIEQKFARQELQLRRQQAKREKATALFNIAIDTAQAIMSALAIGPPQGIILAAAAGATGAIQAAVVASKPLPAYKEGTSYSKKGPALVGEEGFEIMQHKGKTSILGETGPSLVDLPSGAKIFDHVKSLKMISDAEKSARMDMPIQAMDVHKEGYRTITKSNREQVALDQVSKLVLEAKKQDSNKIVSAIKRIPVPGLARHGDQLYDVFEHKNHKKTILNKYRR